MSKFKVGDTWNPNMDTSYRHKSKEVGTPNDNGKYSYDVYKNTQDEDKDAIFVEDDGDIFYTYKDSNAYRTDLIDEGVMDALMKGYSYDKAKNYSSSDSGETSYTNGHQDGTGSTQERVNALRSALTTSQLSTLRNKAAINDNSVDRDSIYKWLEKNGFADSNAVDGGFNVDDVLEYMSTYYNGYGDGNEIFYHLLANEAYLSSYNPQSANNPVNGKLSQTEMKNFFEQREFDEATLSAITNSNTNAWKSSNEDVGSTVHNRFTTQDVIDFYNKYYKNKNSSSSSSSSSKYDDDYTYNNKTISSSSLDTKEEVQNMLNNLKSAGNFEASMTLDSKISVYNSNGTKVSVPKGEYQITNVTSNVVTIEDEDGKTYKLQRGTTSGYFEYVSAYNNAIDEVVYSADKKISTTSSSSSSSYSSNTNGATFNNYVLSNQYNRKTPEQIESYFDNIKKADDFELTLTVSDKYWFDEDHGTVLPTGQYSITKVTGSYVYLEDKNGNEYQIRRGTDEYEFEWYCSYRTQNTSTVKLDGWYEK